MSSDSGATGFGRRDFDDFDELDDDGLGPDEESEFDLQYMDEDDEDDGVETGVAAEDEDAESDEERYGGRLADGW